MGITLTDEYNSLIRWLKTEGIITDWVCDLSGPTVSQMLAGLRFIPHLCRSPFLHLQLSTSTKHLGPVSLKCVIIPLSPVYSHLGKWP